MPKLIPQKNVGRAAFYANAFRRAFGYRLAIVLFTLTEWQMFRTNTHKKPLRYVSVHRRFAHNGTARSFPLNLSAHSRRRDFINANPLFDIAHKIVVIAQFQRCAVGSHIQAVFIFRNVRAVPRRGLIMAFAPIVRITVPLIGVFAALYLIVNRGKAYA